MNKDFTETWSNLLDKATCVLPDGPLESRTIKDFWGLKFDSQMIDWLKNVEVLSHHVFPDGSISLNFTGREFKNWLRTKERKYQEKYV